MLKLIVLLIPHVSWLRAHEIFVDLKVGRFRFFVFLLSKDDGVLCRRVLLHDGFASSIRSWVRVECRRLTLLHHRLLILLHLNVVQGVGLWRLDLFVKDFFAVSVS